MPPTLSMALNPCAHFATFSKIPLTEMNHKILLCHLMPKLANKEHRNPKV